MPKLPKRFLISFLILILVAVAVVAYLIFSQEEVPKEISFNKQQNSINFDATVLGVSEGKLQVLVTKEGSGKVTNIPAENTKFRLLIFDPNTFSVISNQKITLAEIKAGDRIRFAQELEEFPQSFEDLGTIDIYRSETK